MARTLPWQRIVAEGAAIIVSILLAFGIQAWWEEAQLQSELRQDLTALSQELGVTREEIVFQIETSDRMASGGREMVARMESVARSQDVSMPDTLAWLGTTVSPTLEASLGALEALMASGRLSAIPNATVRASLGGLRDQLDDIVSAQTRVSDLYDQILIPSVYDELDWAPLFRVANDFWSDTSVPGRALVHETSVDVPNTLALRNFVGLRSSLISFAVARMRTLQSTVDELIALLPQGSDSWGQ